MRGMATWGLVVLAAAAGGTLVDLGGDSEGERNLAATSKLPRGAGLAANYPATGGSAATRPSSWPQRRSAGKTRRETR